MRPSSFGSILNIVKVAPSALECLLRARGLRVTEPRLARAIGSVISSEEGFIRFITGRTRETTSLGQVPARLAVRHR